MSQSGQRSYRDLFEPPAYRYIGLDIADGPNVDVVPADPYCWTEVSTATVECVISASSFEHNPFFWITAAEISRVVAPGGMVVVIAPSAGSIHRHPLDCWRFYPDAWLALCHYVNWEMLESFVEQQPYLSKLGDTGIGLRWHDSFMVARRPVFDRPHEEDSYIKRMAEIVGTRTSLPSHAPAELRGPATTRYEQRREELGLGGVQQNVKTLLRLARTTPGVIKKATDQARRRRASP